MTTAKIANTIHPILSVEITEFGRPNTEYKKYIKPYPHNDK